MKRKCVGGHHGFPQPKQIKVEVGSEKEALEPGLTERWVRISK